MVSGTTTWGNREVSLTGESDLVAKKNASTFLWAGIVLLTVSLAWGVYASPLEGQSPEANLPGQQSRITILHTNDFHGRLLPESSAGGGSAYVQAYIDEVMDEVGAQNVLLVDAGDVMQGAPISNICPEGWGYSTIDIYNMMGYAVVAVGNHEFDREAAEPGTLEARMSQSDFPWVSANILVEGTTEHPVWVRPYVTMTVGGPGNEVTLGIIGLTTDETPLVTIKGATAGLEFQDPTQAVVRYYDEVKSQSDAMFLLMHIGSRDSGPHKGMKTIARELAGMGKGIDLMIGGHSHEKIHTIVDDTVIVVAYKHGRSVGRLDVTVDPATRRLTVSDLELHDIRTDELLPDPRIEARVAYWAEKVASAVQRAVGTTVVSVTRNYNGESSMGNLVTDAMRWKADLLDDNESNGSVAVALTNPGGLREDIVLPVTATLPYTITWGDTYAVLPFGNSLYLMDLTGAQILGLLDRAATLRKGVLQSSGIAWAWYNDCRCDTPSVWGTYNVRVEGEPLDPATTYRVVTNEFLAGGQDGWVDFAEGTNRTNTYYGVQEAVNDYIGAHSPIAPTIEGRATRKEAHILYVPSLMLGQGV